MDLDSLVEMATFAAVVQAGTFTAAAEELGVSKSVVSRRVAGLEERLGIRLMNRTTRRQELTEVGAAVYERCARIVEQAEAAEVAASVHAEVPRGTLTINAPSLLARTRLVPLLPAFCERHPGVRVELSVADRLRDVVGEGFDLTLRIRSALDDASYVARRLAPVRMAVVGSPEYLARRGVPESPRDLASHDLLRYTLVPPHADWGFEEDGSPVILPGTGPLSADSGVVLLEAVLEGMGLASVPDLEVQRWLDGGELIEVLIDHGREPRSLYALYPHRAGVPPKVSAFVDFLAEHLP